MLLTLVRLASGAPGWADDPAFSTEPAVLLAAASQAPALPEASVRFLFEDVEIQVGEDRAVTRTMHQFYVIDDPSQAPYFTRVDAGWAPWYQAKPEVNARVIRPDGTVARLDPQTAVEEAERDSDATLLDDRRVLHAPLPQVTAGAVVELQIIERPLSAFGPGAAMAREYLPKGRATWPKRVTVSAPARLPLRWTPKTLVTPPVSSTKGGVRTVVFDFAPDASEGDEEPFQPTDTVADFWLQVSTASSWEAESAAYHRLIADRLVAPDLSELLAAAGTKTGVARIEALLAEVRQRVRYTGVEFGEASIIPAPPEEVLRRGWGDCKEQAALLTVLLRSAGIPAEIALIRPGDYDDVSPDHPGLAWFSHAIVHVGGGYDLWIDPSVPQAGATEIPSGEQGHHALVIRKSGGALMKVPWLGPDRDWAEFVSVVDLVPGRPQPIDLQIKARGQLAMINRPQWGQDGVTQIKLAFEKSLGEGAQVSVSRSEGLTRTDTPLDLHIQGPGREPLYNEWIDDYPIEAILEVPPPILRDEIPDDRRRPYGLRPHRRLQVVRIRVPDGYVLDDPPEAARFDDPALSIGVERLTLPTGEEEIRFTSELRAARLEVDEARALAQKLAPFVGRWNGALRVLATPTRAAKEERPGEGVALAKGLAAAHPDNPAYTAVLASVLLGGGFRDSAVAVLADATARFPSDLHLARLRASALLVDPVGRQMMPPMDAVAVRQAASRCLALDDDDETCLGEYGLALLMDDEGRLFGPGAQLEAFVAWADALGDKTPAHLVPLRALTLIRLGRFDAARAFARTAEDPRIQALDIVAIALTEGAEAAAARVSRASPWQRAPLSDTARVELFQLRRYPEAYVIAKAGLAADADERTKKGLEELGRMRRWEDTVSTLAEPAQVVLRFVAAVTSGRTRDEVEGLASAELLARLDDSGTWLTSVRRVLGASFARPSPYPSAPDQALDSLVSNGSIDVEGDKQRGWKVSLRHPSWREPLRFLVMKGKKGLEVRALTALESTLAPEVLRRVGDRDFDGAGWWLDAWQEDEASGENGPAATQLRALGDLDPAHMQTAAALLSPWTDGTVDPILDQALVTETGGRRRRLARALVHRVAARGDVARLEPIVKLLEEDDPTDAASASARFFLETLRGRGDQALPALQGAISAHPRDIGLRSLAVEAAQSPADVAAACDALVKAVESGRPTASDFNNAAWALSFVPGREADALRLVEKVPEIANPSDSALHTLALAQVRAGKISAAVASLQKATENAGGAAYLGDHWWLVRGVIAEAYGLRDEAKAAYRQVGIDPGPSRMRSDVYAAERLRALGG